MLSACGGRIVVPFPHFSIAMVLAEMLAREDLRKGAVFSPTKNANSKATAHRVYGDLSTSQWWEEESQKYSEHPNHCVLSVILYVDGIAVDFFGKLTMIPIMATIGNFSRDMRVSAKGKRLIGFVPKVEKTDNRLRNFKDATAANRELMNNSFARCAIKFPD